MVFEYFSGLVSIVRKFIGNNSPKSKDLYEKSQEELIEQAIKDLSNPATIWIPPGTLEEVKYLPPKLRKAAFPQYEESESS